MPCYWEKEMYIEENAKYINDCLLQLKDKKNIVIWGAAENTVRLFQYTDILKYQISYIVDNMKAGFHLFGRTILSPKEIQWNDMDAVVISSFYHENEIEKELINKYGYNQCIVKLNKEGQASPFYEHPSLSDFSVPSEYRELLAENARFKDIHTGERIFILCTGPSINTMDLTNLVNEKTMAVSNFYMHKDIKVIRPDYYCIPQIVYTKVFDEQTAEHWLKEMVTRGEAKHYFFNVNEKKIIDKSSFFGDKSINYLYFNKMIPYYDNVDLTASLMGVQSVPVLCLQIAIYMGFKEIYLLGVEHDYFLSGNYKYFYSRAENMVGDKDKFTDAVGKVNYALTDIIPIMDILWKQYKIMKKIAESKNIKIYNATKGGILDVFERVNFDEIKF